MEIPKWANLSDSIKHSIYQISYITGASLDSSYKCVHKTCTITQTTIHEVVKYIIISLVEKMFTSTRARDICANYDLPSGWTVDDFDHRQLLFYRRDISSSKLYCFTSNDLKNVALKNIDAPYTTESALSTLPRDKLGVLPKSLKTWGCPIIFLEPDVLFIKKAHMKNSIQLYEVMHEGNLTNMFSEKIYKAQICKYSKKYDDMVASKEWGGNNTFRGEQNFVPEPQIIKMSVFREFVFLDNEKIKFEDISSSIRNILNDYITESYYPTAKEVGEILSKNIRIHGPIKLYRGIAFSKEKFPFGIVSLGEMIQLKDTAEMTSWTTDPCVAAHFAQENAYGIVVSYTSTTPEIVIDLRLVTGAPYEQSEVILKKGHRMVKIELLIHYGAIIKQIKK